MTFGFADPLALLLMPLPLLALRLLPPGAGIGAALVVPDGLGRRLSGLSGRAAGARRGLWLGALAWSLLVVALAGPRQLVPTPALPVSGRDLVLALDLSGSMVREDFELDGETASRLDAVKRVAARFVRGRKGDRVALVVFGSEAYVAAAPSFDTQAVARAIEGAEIGISGRATNIGDALGLALKRLQGSDADSRVVILLSDGANNAGAARPDGVAALAAGMGVRVHTIAMGPRDFTTADPGEPGAVDAAALRRIAQTSGGESFRVRTTADLEAVAQAIDRLEPTAGDGLAAEIHRPLWIWPAMLGGALCLVLTVRGPE
ncbi:VWA domain-containing protein [Rhodovulum marinum]|uniref:Ca-activated chloride channel family protein n=1 Tax=Rhodovulum marinum TaxID=320662 RepID=A0A4V2SQV0_9RHOB|nr:VWA domain-containing protein [Rhodovulum marinum]TCP40416.1 Ca-activated chloride channel family protein [Rhodovulum marinum]